MGVVGEHRACLLEKAGLLADLPLALCWTLFLDPLGCPGFLDSSGALLETLGLPWPRLFWDFWALVAPLGYCGALLESPWLFWEPLFLVGYSGAFLGSGGGLLASWGE